jgi:membrane associated rhomboid family serine protease
MSTLNVEVPDLTPRWLLSKVPVTVCAFVLIQYYITTNGIAFYDVFGRSPLNPFLYTVNMFFHAGGWSHYAGNMWLWIPFGTLFTWFTSNRHLLWFAFAVNFMTVLIALFIEELGLGMSHVVFGVVAATLVRSVGLGLRNGSQELLQVGITVPLTFGVVGFFVVMVFAGPRWIADFYHLLGFMFGGAIESMYVLNAHEGG